MLRIKYLLQLFLIIFMALTSACTNESELPDSVDMPEIVSFYPGDGSVNIPVDAILSVTFADEVSAESIAPSGVDGACFGTIQISDNDFDSCIEISNPTSEDNKTFTATPLQNLNVGVNYKVKIFAMAQDDQGNSLLTLKYQTPNGFTTVSDNNAPTPGNSGTITYNNLDADSMALAWTAATDDIDDASTLIYKVVQSVNDNISTVGQAETNGSTVMDWTSNFIDSASIPITELTSAVTYYFNIIVKDSDGNTNSYRRIAVKTLDNIAPTPGAPGTLAVSDLSSDSLTLSWTSAYDNSDDASSLSYKIVKSSSDNISSLSLAESNGVVVKDWTTNLASWNITDLNSSSAYYFNVLVKDTSENKSAYVSQTATTLDIDPPVPGDGESGLSVDNIEPTSLSISWTPAADTIDNASLLQYKVVFAADAAYIDTATEADNTSDSNITTACDWQTGISECDVSGLSASVNFYLNVLVKDTSGNIAIYAVLSAITSDNVAPVVSDSALEYSNLAPNSVKVNWSAATDNSDDSLIRYKLVKSDDNDINTVSGAASATVVKDWSSDLSADVAELTSAQTYYFNVLVKDGSDNTTIYNSSSITTLDNIPPEPPASGTINIDALEGESITLSWTSATDNSDDAQIRYKVVVSLSDEIQNIEDATVSTNPLNSSWTSDNSADISGLESSRLYYFNVLVKDGSDNKAIYDATSATTLDNILPTPGASGLLTVSDLSHDSLKLNWTTATDNSDDASILTYKAVKSLSDNIDSTDGALNNGSVVQDWSSDLSADASGLTIGQLWYFNVLVKDGAGNIAAYDSASGAAIDNISPTPESLTIILDDLSSDYATMRWAKAADNHDNTTDLQYMLVKAESSSQIDTAEKISITPIGRVTQTLTADATSATAYGLEPDTTYYFNAMVQDASGNQAAYTVLEVKTLDINPPSPGGNLDASTTKDTVTLSWTQASDTVDQASELLYLIGMSTSSMNSTSDVESNSVNEWTTYSDIEKMIIELIPETEYYLDVAVKNSRGKTARYGQITAATETAAWPDSTFDGDGMVNYNPSPSDTSYQVNAMISGPDGSAMLTGNFINSDGSYSMVVWSYDDSASLDGSFSGDGLTLEMDGQGLAIAIDNQDRILVAGSVQNGDHTDWAIWRYLPDGTLDSTFDGDSGNGNGKVTYDEDGSNDAAQTITVDSQGRILTTGYITSGGNKELAVFRFLDDGSLDYSFDDDGYATYNGGNNDDQASSMILDHKERPIIVGYTHNGSNKDLLVIRLTADGSFDAAFGSDGVATHHNAAGGNGDDEGFDVKLDDQGRILIVGRSWNGADFDMALWSYLPNGELDVDGFNPSYGYAVHDDAAGGGGNDIGYGLTFDNQGLIIVAGSSYNSNNNLDMTIWRYKPDGSFDDSFNNPDGWFYKDFGAGKDDEAFSVFIDDAGRILASGYMTNYNNETELALWRMSAPENTSDLTAPEPGSGGAITVDNITTESLKLSWTAADDASSEYKVFKSESDNIATIAEALVYGEDLSASWQSDASLDVSELASGNTYYFNVVVKDGSDNKAAYSMQSATTVNISSSQVESLKFYTEFTKLTFSETMDLSSLTLNTGDTTCSGSIQISLDSFGSCVQMSDISTDDNKTFVIYPNAALNTGSNYTIKLTTAIQDSDAAYLESEYNATLTARVYGSSWQEATSAAWDSGRMDYGSVVFQDKIWIFGGNANGTAKSDVWNSADGKNWTKIGDADWSDRSLHNSVVFQDKMWVMGGNRSDGAKLNDVWYSSDGATWTEATADAAWPDRWVQKPIVFNNKVWIMGGSNGSSYLGDIWNSSDGITWNEVTPDGDVWSGRSWITPVVFNNKIWIIGGQNSSGNLSDVYYSEDGQTWVKESDNAVGIKAASSNMFFDDKIWVIGGYDGNFLNQVWYSEDGSNWTQSTNAPWGARDRHSSVVFGNKIWVMGGNNSYHNDVWYMDESWTQASASAQKSDGSPAWDARSGFAKTVFDGKIWIMGGNDGTDLTSDVWYSEDGSNWTEATNDAGWSAREYHSAAAFDGKLWVMGGGQWDTAYNKDVWYSSDGVTWTEATDDAWEGGVRLAHSTVVFDGKIWAMGGRNSTNNLDDVWDSTDGVNWNQTTNTAWTTDGRYGQTAAVFGDKMWVMGGYNAADLNDVWYSEDGISWMAASSADWNGRHWFTSAVFDDKLWILGGHSVAGKYNDVWYSEDGENWVQYNSEAPWEARGYYEFSVSFNDRLWVMGGAGASSLNDAWYMENGKSEAEAPNPGDSGSMNFSNIGSVGMEINWTAATDNSDDASDLRYKVVYGDANNIDTPVKAIMNGTVVQDWDYDIASAEATGLSAELTYYFSVIVKDSQGNMTLYNGGSQATLALSSAEVESIEFHTKFIEITFSEEMDPDSLGISSDCSSSLNIYDSLHACVGISSISTTDNKTFILTPSSDLSSASDYYAKLGSEVEDSSGASLTESELATVTLSATVYGSNWQAASTPTWSGRWEHDNVVFDNKLWIIGGGNNTSANNEVWYSEDGENWTNANNTTWTTNSMGHSVVVFDDKLWILGGRPSDGYASHTDEIWNSSDGITWTPVTPSETYWSARSQHVSVVFDDKMWVIGGRDDSAGLSDVWSSSDGANWTKEVDTALWAVSDHIPAGVVFENKIWMLGVGDRNDIYDSTDGVNWNLVADTPDWSTRYAHSAVVFDNKIWIMAGWDTTFRNDVYYSTDGVNWELGTDSISWNTDRQRAVVFQNKIMVTGGKNSTTAYQKIYYLDETWTQASASVKQSDGTAAWSARFSHARTVFDDKIWIMGGNDGSNKNDVWYSEDGTVWSKAKDNDANGWNARSYHNSLTFNDKMWVIGGNDGGYKNDVWYSTDGETWENATTAAGWSSRYGQTAVVFDNKMWVMGGWNGSNYLNDVWYSTDGASWTEVTSAAGWSSRYGQTAVVFDNKMWVMGGWNGSNQKDVWYSEDGITWTQATAAAWTTGRHWLASDVFDDRIWILGGRGDSNHTNEVWHSKDGANWTKYNSSAQWDERAYYEFGVYFNDRLWVMGGTNYNFSSSFNDVWYMETMKTETIAPVSGDSGNLATSDVTYDSVTISWTKATDNSDDASELRYKIVKSTSDNISNLEDALANGTSDMVWTTDVATGVANDLSPITTYYFNVIVKDTQGNMSVYNTVSETTSGYTVSAPSGLNTCSCALDAATGTGYIMYSEEDVHTRFSSTPPITQNNPNFIVIRNNSGQWQYDTNTAYVDFTPQSTDILVAEVDFTNDTATTLDGENSSVNGIIKGYHSGNLNVKADTELNKDNLNDGEFYIYGLDGDGNESAITFYAW